MLAVFNIFLSQAYHRYALNYINALNYLESLRRHQEFCDFEKVSGKSLQLASISTVSGLDYVFFDLKLKRDYCDDFC